MRVGVDVGGTFTDLAVVDAEGVRIAKVPSTPAAQAEGVRAGLALLGLDPSEVRRFVHGTTVATNAVLERRGARTVLVTTAGFRDLLEIGRQDRPSLYDQWADRTPPLVPRELVVEAAERIAADGTVLRPLEDTARLAAEVRSRDPEAVAVCLLFSFLDDRHERAIGDALGDLPVSLSSQVLPTFREYERASTTVLNAYVSPVVGRYLDALASELAAAGLRVGVEVMRSGGGTSQAAVAARTAVHTLLSGPAAGAWGAAAVARAAGIEDVVAFDMGGTSTDVSLILGGRPRTTSEGRIAGLPFAVRTVDVHTIGAGGGSIAWRDAGGALRVGPRSAGADPGPACYGRGGTQPTVTDAQVVLGWLGAHTPLGGRLPLHADLAATAVAELGGLLGMDPEACATGIVTVVEAQMVAALRVVSVERGVDPRQLTLVPFGGAGALHQGTLARELGCRRVLVPRYPGVLAALGLLAAPLTADAVRTHLAMLAEVDGDALERGWRQLEAQVEGELRRQGVDHPVLRRTADLRYRGQAYELEVAAPVADPERLAAAFHDAHRDRYGYAQPDQPVEVVNLRVVGEGPAPPLELPPLRGGEATPVGTVEAVVDGGRRPVPLYRREALGAGAHVDGPALLAGTDATVLLLGGQRASVDEVGNLHIEER